MPDDTPLNDPESQSPPWLEGSLDDIEVARSFIPWLRTIKWPASVADFHKIQHCESPDEMSPSDVELFKDADHTACEISIGSAMPQLTPEEQAVVNRFVIAEELGIIFSENWNPDIINNFATDPFTMLSFAKALEDISELPDSCWEATEEPGASRLRNEFLPDNGCTDATNDSPPLLSPQDPLRSAQEFVAGRHLRFEPFFAERDLPALHYQQGLFYRWDGSHYVAIEASEIRSELYQFLDAAQRWDVKNTQPTRFQPTANKVNDVMDGLRALANVPQAVEMPTWLDGAPEDAPAPHEIIAFRNGMLHLPTLTLWPHTPAFFTTNGLDFDLLASDLTPGEWLRFLDQLWPDDPQAISTLQEIFGYCLTGDTRQQKIFMIVGPKRSGKGTISRVLTALLGKHNICAPTLSALGQNFGLQPLIDKRLAVISDARIGNRADQHTIAERLLSISGEDTVTIDRKYLVPWTGRLQTRFLILTNELPRVSDASGALASRFILLTLRRSFLDREDHGLVERLLDELPAILLWSIVGWHRLRERGHFLQPSSSSQMALDLEELGSPVTEFIRDHCEIGADLEVPVASLFAAWCRWCGAAKLSPGTIQIFGRDLRAAVPSIEVKKRRIGTKREQSRVYAGLGLSTNRDTSKS